jgi:hypothetical protein
MGREQFEALGGGLLVEHTRLVGGDGIGVASHERCGLSRRELGLSVCGSKMISPTRLVVYAAAPLAAFLSAPSNRSITNCEKVSAIWRNKRAWSFCAI